MKVVLIVHNGGALTESQQTTIARSMRNLTNCDVCTIEEVDFGISNTSCENEEKKALKEAFKTIDLHFRNVIRQRSPLLLAVEIVKYISKHKEDSPVSVACDVICRAQKHQEFYYMANEFGINKEQVSAIMSAVKD